MSVFSISCLLSCTSTISPTWSVEMDQLYVKTNPTNDCIVCFGISVSEYNTGSHFNTTLKCLTLLKVDCYSSICMICSAWFWPRHENWRSRSSRLHTIMGSHLALKALVYMGVLLRDPKFEIWREVRRSYWLNWRIILFFFIVPVNLPILSHWHQSWINL